jgi:hypothetical protein
VKGNTGILTLFVNDLISSSAFAFVKSEFMMTCLVVILEDLIDPY